MDSNITNTNPSVKRLTRRTWYRLGALLCAGGILAAVVVADRRANAPHDSLDGLESWNPTPQFIIAQIGNVESIAPGLRRKAFIQLFRKRFTDHNVGVSLRMVGSDRAHLLCVAMMTRRDMARVAIATMEELRQVFQRNFAVDIIETTAVGSRKVAEVRRTGASQIDIDFGKHYEENQPSTSSDVVQMAERDFLPPITSATFVPARAAHVPDDASLIGFSNGRLARAYDINLLNHHEVVNDLVGQQSILVTWCSLCQTAHTYDRKAHGRVLTFGLSGHLWHNSMVLYDHETGTLWSQMTGEAIKGPMKGTRLSLLACTPRIAWRAWRLSHPDSGILSVRGVIHDPVDSMAFYKQMDNHIGLLPIRRPDIRAPAKSTVLGIVVGRQSKAYSVGLLSSKRIVNDELAGSPLLIWCDPTSGATAVYRKPYHGTYTLNGDTIVGPSGRWQAATGKATGGGRDLVAFPHTLAYWFGWSDSYPGTQLVTQ